MKSETPQSGSAHYYRPPRFDVERLQVLSDGYFGLSRHGAVGVVAWALLMVLTQSSEMQNRPTIFKIGCAVTAIATAFAIYKDYLAIAKGYGWLPVWAAIAVILTVCTAPLFGCILAIWIFQIFAWDRLRFNGLPLKASVFQLSQRQVNDAIQALREQGSPRKPGSPR